MEQDLNSREAAAALRFIKSDDGKLLLAWMRRSAGLSDSPPAPEASDALLRHMSGRQWLVNTLLQLARKAE